LQNELNCIDILKFSLYSRCKETELAFQFSSVQFSSVQFYRLYTPQVEQRKYPYTASFQKSWQLQDTNNHSTPDTENTAWPMPWYITSFPNLQFGNV